MKFFLDFFKSFITFRVINKIFYFIVFATQKILLQSLNLYWVTFEVTLDFCEAFITFQFSKNLKKCDLVSNFCVKYNSL